MSSKNLNFRSKIFLSFALLIFLTTSAILMVVSFQLKSKMKQVLMHDLQGVNRILQEYEKARLELLKTKAMILAEEPRLKAALDTRDSFTVVQEAQKFIHMAETDFMILTDADGSPLATIGASQPHFLRLKSVPTIREALKFKQTTAISKIGDSAFQIVSSPVTILDPFGRSVLLGTVSIGLKISDELLSQLHGLTDCSVVFIYKNKGKVHPFIAASPDVRQITSLDRRKLEAWNVASSKVREIRLWGAKQLVLTSTLAGDRDHYLLLFRSLDQSLSPILLPTQQLLLIIGLFSLLISLIISFFLSRSISSPLTKLTHAIHRVSQGDLDKPVRLSRRDEIGRLAHDFDDMRCALKQYMADLEKTYARLVISEKLATTGKLMAHLSHELNNPIHNIRSALETSLKKWPPSADRSYIDIAYKELLRLERLVRQTLNFYRPSPNDYIFFDLNELLRELISISRKSFLKKGIQIIEDLTPTLPQIYANRDQMKQVFLNLLLNAKEATSAGGSVIVATRTEGGKIRVEVRDTGTGIALEDRDKVFDAFFTTKSKVSGVGLGLSVSYEIINQHGGEIYVDPDYKAGALFVIRLPRKGVGK